MRLIRLFVIAVLASSLALPASAQEIPQSAQAVAASTPVAERGPGLTYLTHGADGLEVHRLSAGEPSETSEALRRLRNLDHVVVAEADVRVAAMGDALRHFQWGLDRLQAETAWTHSEGTGQKVAVVDTGVDGSHPDLAGVVLPGFDAFGASDGRTDVNGHGTHVAGIVAAVSGNTIGVEGLARKAKILPIKVLEDDGNGYSSDVASGILWAVANGATVINLSLGSPTTSAVVDNAIRHAVAQGITVVAASGNEGAKGNPVMYPAALPETIAVGAVDTDDTRAAFSGNGTWLDLVAPGVQIASTMSGQYMYSSGTSMAAPYVSAGVAMLRAKTPTMTPAQILAHLRATAEDLGPKGKDNEFGYGLMDVVKALSTPLGGGTTNQATTGVTPVGTATDLVQAAAEVSRTAFTTDATATMAVLARDDAFADSLAGAALAGAKGPILYTAGGPDAGLRAETAAELRRVLVPGSTVNLLGGPGAISDRVRNEVQAMGFVVRRLQGPSRVETALAIADAVSPAPQRVILARADQWADAVTGGAYAAAAGVPLLLTQSDSLHPAVAAWLMAKQPAEVILLGGEAALSSAVAAAVPANWIRIAGSTRAGTAVAVAKYLWNRRVGTIGDRFVAVDGFASDSWSPALAASVLSAKQVAPQILVNGGAPDSVSPETAAYLSELGYGSAKAGTAYLVGPKVGASTASRLSSLLNG